MDNLSTYWPASPGYSSVVSLGRDHTIVYGSLPNTLGLGGRTPAITCQSTVSEAPLLAGQVDCHVRPAIPTAAQVL
jgi:hypothetical protein